MLEGKIKCQYVIIDVKIAERYGGQMIIIIYHFILVIKHIVKDVGTSIIQIQIQTAVDVYDAFLCLYLFSCASL